MWFERRVIATHVVYRVGGCYAHGLKGSWLIRTWFKRWVVDPVLIAAVHRSRLEAGWLVHILITNQMISSQLQKPLIQIKDW